MTPGTNMSRKGRVNAAHPIAKNARLAIIAIIGVAREPTGSAGRATGLPAPIQPATLTAPMAHWMTMFAMMDSLGMNGGSVPRGMRMPSMNAKRNHIAAFARQATPAALGLAPAVLMVAQLNACCMICTPKMPSAK